jgi:hypothetical protein
MRKRKSGDTLFTRMIGAGDRLIEAQRLEESLAILAYQRRTAKDMARWKEARRWVEALAVEYGAAVREWLAGIQTDLGQERSRLPSTKHA